MALTDENSGIPATMLVGPTGYAGGMPYPVYQGGNSGFGMGGELGWLILILLLAGNGGWGMGGFGGFGGGMGYDFPWLLNGQQNVSNNVSDGFRDAQLHDSVTSVRDGVSSLAQQLCSCCGDMQMSLANAQSAISTQLCNNEIASLNRSFAEQTANTAGFSGVNSGIADLRYTVATEACADRAAVSDALRDVIAANTASTQRILDQLCADKIEAKNDEIARLRQELNMQSLAASQAAQNTFISQGFANEVDALYNRLNTCPVPTTPVYGRTPIFTCNSNGCGCGCGGNAGFVG